MGLGLRRKELQPREVLSAIIAPPSRRGFAQIGNKLIHLPGTGPFKLEHMVSVFRVADLLLQAKLVMSVSQAQTNNRTVVKSARFKRLLFRSGPLARVYWKYYSRRQ